MPTDTAVVRYLNPPALERPPGYSHVVDVRANRLIFIAGQAGVDANGTVVGGNVEAQAEQAFHNLSAALESVGCTAANLVKLTVFVRDMGKLADYRRIRDRFFNSVNPPVAPAVTLVEVSSGRPADGLRRASTAEGPCTHAIAQCFLALALGAGDKSMPSASSACA